MGNAGGHATADRRSKALAAGLPEELDWRVLLSQIFGPDQRAAILLTSEDQTQPATGQPCKRVQCLRVSGDAGAPAVEADPDTIGPHVGLLSQKGAKVLPNQDSAFFLEFVDGDGAQVWMACVMDGHGPLGHLMSRLVMQWLPMLVLRDPAMATDAGFVVPSDPLAVFNGITAAFAKMGALMRRASAGTLEKELSGTTCVFALFARGLLHTANVGDSRAVLGTLRSEASASAFALNVDVRPLTRDHKPDDAEERPRIEKQGGIVERQRVYLKGWPHLGLNLSRSFGDTLAHAVGVCHTPDVAATFLDRGTGQFLLLASDGVWEFMSSEDAAESVAVHLQEADRGTTRAAEHVGPAQGAAVRLVRRATDTWRHNSDELDDITAIVVKISWIGPGG